MLDNECMVNASAADGPAQTLLEYNGKLEQQRIGWQQALERSNLNRAGWCLKSLEKLRIAFCQGRLKMRKLLRASIKLAFCLENIRPCQYVALRTSDQGAIGRIQHR